MIILYASTKPAKYLLDFNYSNPIETFMQLCPLTSKLCILWNISIYWLLETSFLKSWKEGSYGSKNWWTSRRHRFVVSHFQISYHGGTPCDPDARDHLTPDTARESKQNMDFIRGKVRSTFPDTDASQPAITEMCMFSVSMAWKLLDSANWGHYITLFCNRYASRFYRLLTWRAFTLICKRLANPKFLSSHKKTNLSHLRSNTYYRVLVRKINSASTKRTKPLKDDVHAKLFITIIEYLLQISVTSALWIRIVSRLS